MAKTSKILVINPNSSVSMTRGMEKMIANLGYGPTIQIHTYTAPAGPESINNEDDAAETAEIVLEDFRKKNIIENYDGLVIACYSVHPLTTHLKSLMRYGHEVPVIGIFEASIMVSLDYLSSEEQGEFGIVTTGKYWEKVLSQGVEDFLSHEETPSSVFRGVESTGLSAAELHTTPPEQVRVRMIEATKRLLNEGAIRVICLGCAGMAGMDVIVREACIEQRGEKAGAKIQILDGIVAGISIVKGMIKTGF